MPEHNLERHKDHDDLRYTDAKTTLLEVAAELRETPAESFSEIAEIALEDGDGSVSRSIATIADKLTRNLPRRDDAPHDTDAAYWSRKDVFVPGVGARKVVLREDTGATVLEYGKEGEYVGSGIDASAHDAEREMNIVTTDSWTIMKLNTEGDMTAEISVTHLDESTVDMIVKRRMDGVLDMLYCRYDADGNEEVLTGQDPFNLSSDSSPERMQLASEVFEGLLRDLAEGADRIV